MIEGLYSTYYKELLGWCKSMTQDTQQAAVEKVGRRVCMINSEEEDFIKGIGKNIGIEIGKKGVQVVNADRYVL